MEEKERKESVELFEESGGGLFGNGARAKRGVWVPTVRAILYHLALSCLKYHPGTLDSLCAYAGAESAGGRGCFVSPFSNAIGMILLGLGLVSSQRDR